MTITQLEYVLAVATHRNFTLASEKCFVTQPTLSMQIQKLEDELDIRVFDRSKKPIKVTKIGESIVAQARIVINESKRISDIVDSEKGEISGDFRIGIIPTIIPTLLPLFLKTFMNKYPEVKISIEELQTYQIVQQLKDGDIDVGIAATPLEEDSIFEKPIYYEPFVAFLPDNHKLFGKKKLSSNDLELTEMLLLEDGHCFRNNIINLCKSDQELHSSKINLETGSFDALVQLTKDGFGYTLLPYLHTNRMRLEDKKNLKEFEKPFPAREVSIVYGKSQLKLQIIEALNKTITSIIKGVILTEETQITSPI